MTGQLHGGPFGVPLTLRLLAYTCGVARLRITETNPLHGPRWEPTDILEEGLEGALLRVRFTCAEAKTLRVSVNSFFDLLHLVNEQCVLLGRVEP